MNAQLTLVSHYGKKSRALKDIIHCSQNILSTSFGSHFSPYGLEQVHGTIISLEGIHSQKGILNTWFMNNLCQQKYMDFKSILDFLHSDFLDAIEFKIGGWSPDTDYGFTSRGLHPYLRSFSINGDIAVVMGWPYKDNHYTDSLYFLRKSFEKVNILHKWHENNYKDNDFYFVIGRIDKDKVNPDSIDNTSIKLKNALADMNATFNIAKNTLSIVSYTNTQLPLSTSKSFKINDPRLTPDLIENLYH